MGIFVFACIVLFAYLGKHRNEPVELLCLVFFSDYFIDRVYIDIERVTSKTRLERTDQA